MYKKLFKRFFDLLFSLIGLPFFLLIFIPVIIAIKLEDKGQIFYNALRNGKNGKPFQMYKFRTMIVNAPDIRLADGSTYNSDDDPRVTHVGKFLRKTSIDELPQLLNIILGQMSFVGPRPDPVDWLDRYSEEDRKMLSVLPGITGYNQAYFRNSADGATKIKNDVFYADHISFLLDINIVFKTVKCVLFKENIYVDQERATVTQKTDSMK